MAHVCAYTRRKIHMRGKNIREGHAHVVRIVQTVRLLRVSPSL